MLNKKIKSGFTLIELMVFFIFISLIMAAATPIITKRVKNIPLKFNHGKFICYDDGHYELYNSTRIIDKGTGCKFKPPRRAALYKIELVGAGAGGYNYTEPVTEKMFERQGGYTLTGGSYGDGYTELSDGQLWHAFVNASFTLTQPSGAGGKGDSVSTGYNTFSRAGLSPLKDCFESYWYPSTCTCKVDDLTKPILDKDGKPTGKYEQKDEECACQKFQRDDPKGLLLTCSDYDYELNSKSYEIGDLKYCYSGGDWCYNLISNQSKYATALGIAARPPYTASLDSYSEAGDVTGYAASGGSSVTLVLDGNIDFRYYGDYGSRNVPAKETKSYLSKLITEYYKTGTTQYRGSCANWGYKEENKHDGKYGDSKNVGLPINSEGYQLGKWGSDIMYYGAIKGWGSCATNCDRATGGQGGWLKFNSDNNVFGSYSSSRERGRDASGVCGSVKGPYQVYIANKSDMIPYVYTTTTLNTRYHAVGDGGGAGSTIVTYVTNLSDDCVFNVSPGGAPVNEGVSTSELDYLHNGLATTLSCNKGTLKLKAPGGIYNTTITTGVYNGFKYLNHDGTSKAPAEFVTEGAGGGGSRYVSSDVFNKFNPQGGGFGAGGRGSKIVDECTKPWGRYSIFLAYNTGSKTLKDHQNIEKVACDENKQVHYEPAEAGTGGVIIISW